MTLGTVLCAKQRIKGHFYLFSKADKTLLLRIFLIIKLLTNQLFRTLNFREFAGGRAFFLLLRAALMTPFLYFF